MGRASQELKEVMERLEKKAAEGAEKYPIRKKRVSKPLKVNPKAVGYRLNVDYHVVKYTHGQYVPAGWLSRSVYKSYVQGGSARPYLDQHKENKAVNESTVCNALSVWYLYPGPRPNPKWGPVCP